MRTFLFKDEIVLYRNPTGDGKRCFEMLLVIVVLGKQTEVANRDRIYDQKIAKRTTKRMIEQMKQNQYRKLRSVELSSNRPTFLLSRLMPFELKQTISDAELVHAAVAKPRGLCVFLLYSIEHR